MTGSVLLPIKSLVMNVLAIAAAFGVMVLIFQDGRFQDVLDISPQAALEVTQRCSCSRSRSDSRRTTAFPTDAHQGGRDEGLSNEEAVALGVQRTGKIITAAAMLFVIAIGAFATSKIIFIKQVGVGTSAAVVIDATLVPPSRAVTDEVARRLELVGFQGRSVGCTPTRDQRGGTELPPSITTGPAAAPEAPPRAPEPYRPL